MIADFLKKNNIDVVLSGGSCVSMYVDNPYESKDLDFVLYVSEERKNVDELLQSIGFFREGRYLRHKDTEFFLDFLLPPPSIGEEPIRIPAVIKRGKRCLKLLSPTDCIKDRLAAYYYWDDRQCLEQAILVGLKHPVDLSEIERWSNAEGMSAKFKVFLKRVKVQKK